MDITVISSSFNHGDEAQVTFFECKSETENKPGKKKTYKFEKELGGRGLFFLELCPNTHQKGYVLKNRRGFDLYNTSDSIAERFCNQLEQVSDDNIVVLAARDAFDLNPKVTNVLSKIGAIAFIRASDVHRSAYIFMYKKTNDGNIILDEKISNSSVTVDYTSEWDRMFDECKTLKEVFGNMDREYKELNIGRRLTDQEQKLVALQAQNQEIILQIRELKEQNQRQTLRIQELQEEKKHVGKNFEIEKPVSKNSIVLSAALVSFGIMMFGYALALLRADKELCDKLAILSASLVAVGVFIGGREAINAVHSVATSLWGFFGKVEKKSVRLFDNLEVLVVEIRNFVKQAEDLTRTTNDAVAMLSQSANQFIVRIYDKISDSFIFLRGTGQDIATAITRGIAERKFTPQVDVVIRENQVAVSPICAFNKT